ncbi:ABC transporter substrate-binding protein [Spirillospora sp. NPDC048824]|uniref:ABC transporter substrate-binding protein n=1 Tax=Spirillospora sp. NPDC048824 TaxID=3364526 RepID=UPI00370FEB4B
MGLVTTQRRRHRRRAAAAGLALATCAAVTTACSGGATSGAGSGPEGTPVRGGNLVYGLGADANGFNPITDSFAPQTYAMAGTIIETLTTVDAAGQWRPLLAESLEPSKNAARWTIRLREGITFSNEQPLDAETVKANLDAQKASPLTAAVLAPVSGIELVDARTVQIDLESPWVSFPYTLASQIGMIVPQIALTDPDKASREPVGTGPFMFQSHTPDNRFIVKRNPAYWREGLPYLDRVEFRILPDFQTRAQTLESGGLAAMATQRDNDIVKFGKLAEQGAYRLYRVAGMSVPEMAFMLNTAAGPTKDLRVRQAMAHATDRDAFIKTLRSGLTKPADGPWSPDSPWYVPGGYPAFDPAKAKALISEYEREKGPVQIELLSISDQSSMQNAELVQDMWKKAGIDVTIRQADQADLIQRALMGNYGAIVWEQFNRPDPDSSYSYLHSRFAQPVGSISINMSRIKDEQLSAALDAGRAASDEAARKKAYATVQKRLRAELPFIWVDHLSTSAVVTKPNVHGLAQYKLPDGSAAKPLIGSPTHAFGQIWMGR